MIHFDKDPTLKTYFAQLGLQSAGYYTGELDNWHGTRTTDALAAAKEALMPSPVPPTGGLPNKARDISLNGITLIKHFEGLFLKAYQDIGGVWTIGWGRTGLIHKDGTVYRGRTITQTEAEALLRYDLDVFEARVSRLITVPLNDNEFAALVSFDFNSGGLQDSSLRRLLNKGDRAGAAAQFGRWIFDKEASDKPVPGLIRRRASERNMFLGKEPFFVQS